VLLAFFWDDIQKKTGPSGIRGAIGERGDEGVNGSCGMEQSKAYLIMSLNKFIDDLYKAKTGKNLLNTETQRFPNTYLNNKISVLASSSQYNILIQTASNYNKTIENIVNYVKSIWNIWFDLIYNANSKWFEDEFGDEEYNWNSENPFVEIRKYDIYYWGISRVFRPLKAEICRSNSEYESAKLPKKPEARLKIIYSNDYDYIGDDYKTGGDPDASWWRPKIAEYGNDIYYPVGDIITAGDGDEVYWGLFSEKQKTQVGDLVFDTPERQNTYRERSNGPALKSLLVSGDIKDPIAFNPIKNVGGDQRLALASPVCPDNYVSLGDILKSGNYINPKISNIKCIPADCVEPIINNTYTPIWKQRSKINIGVLNHYNWGDNEVRGDNGYNLFRANGPNYSQSPLYRIKDKCITPDTLPETKDPEVENAELGIGWFGHPYKLEPQYSIFAFLGLVPEGLIVHEATGRRYYIIHYGGDEVNIYNVLEYNKLTDKFDAGLQIDNGFGVSIKTLSRKDPRQQWKIILQNDKKYLKLQNIENNNYLYIGLEPNTGISQYSTIDIDNYRSKNNNIYFPLSDVEIQKNITFSFIPAFGTHLNILNEKL
jgi:hypothetical protein